MKTAALAKKNSEEESKEPLPHITTINEEIEEFLESDFEIKASNAAKKALQASKRFSMFNPSKLLALSPFS